MSLLHGIRQQLRDLVGGSAADDLREEIAHHLDLETARHVAAGCDPAIARARALARFGNPVHITDATRDERGSQLLEGGMQDLQWAIRSLRKSPGFSALALFTLVLGIGATTVAFTVLDTVLLRPLPYRESDRLVFIQERTVKRDLLPPSYPNFASWREQTRSFDGVASAMFSTAQSVWPAGEGSEAIRVPAMGVSTNFFKVLGVSPVAGREFSPEESTLGGAAAVMVSYEFWQTQLGARRPLGALHLGGTDAPIVGVLPRNFQFLSPADVYFPHERGPGTFRSSHNYQVIARLKPGATLEVARAEMTALSKSLLATYGDATQAVDASVIPLRDYVVADHGTMVTIVFGAAALVLLIACTNLMSAQLARGRAREREVVVRAALGASRARITRQLLFESGVLVLIGAVVAAAFSALAVQAIRTLGGTLVPRLNELAIDLRVLAFVTGMAVATVLLVGVYPALRLSGRDAGLVLRSGRSAGISVRASVWRLLVGFEIALAVMLLIGSALLIRTLHNILSADIGFTAQGLATAAISPRKGDESRLEEIRARLAAIPGVAGVAFTNGMPLAWGNVSAPVRRVGDPVDHDWPAMAGYRVVSANYFSVLEQPILDGRAFNESDRNGGQPVAIITRGIADKLWPGQNPVGRTIATNYLPDQWLTVVGIVTEASSWKMARGSQNEIFVPFEQHSGNHEGQLIAMIRTPGEAAALIPAIRAELHRVAPSSPAQFGTMTERIARSAADRRFAMLALTAFGVIALVLAGVGIYGVIWYIVSTRTHEIGIRMALGATGAAVRTEVLGSAAVMAAGGIAVGLLVGVFATRYLQATLYGVSRLDPATYAIGAAVALATTVMAAYIPARRSSRVDPMVALRGD